MSKYVAMLRGIGPGNPNMTADKFKSFFEGLGYSGVKVVLASGNIIFESPMEDKEELAITIEEELPKKLGFARSAVIRSQSELKNLIAKDPFKGIEDSHNKNNYLLVTFFRNTPAIPFKLPYTPDNKPYRLLGKIDDAVYGVVDISKSKTPDYMAWLETQFGKKITSRTPKTLRYILKRMESG